MSYAPKTTLCAAAIALCATLAAPAASADVIDDYLARVPAGQISCDQAQRYYTNAGDYNAKKNQALAAANFHPRGGEIRGAIARADEAIARCGLNGGPARPAPAAPGTPAGPAAPGTPGAPGAPAPAPAVPADHTLIPILVQPGMPTVDVPVPPARVTFRLPDAAKILQQQAAQVGQLSSR
ncbi:hypothetical protein G7Y31_00350 [Corynebacterium lizhenjunii]|uniref:Secreted protein n=1 Tax=Corynebacterium lizhenjunii TaxID=2709394 RepID=A0A7T0KF70_9CORY|nr:hypothetical protein [Corynebacterium lizhenjunii]QPK79226.1 hypothetical protein G7Y31_00350 [Corynebacterium lizhenjunii]